MGEFKVAAGALTDAQANKIARQIWAVLGCSG